MPSVSGLMQNHPNPFNPTTTIAYDVAEAGHVTIEVYDVSGRLVQRLVNAHKDAGRHQASWNGRDMNGSSVHTGVYFYRMSAPGYQSPAKKMLLLK
jgi:flagellar hook assembly protein FlgD